MGNSYKSPQAASPSKSLQTVIPDGNLLPWLAQGYWAESRRPLVSLLFIAPLLIAYELGVVVFGVQNGADAWMRRFLDLMGFSRHFLLPVLMVCILLAWHHLSRQPWRFSRGILASMAAECVLLAFCLRLIYQIQLTLLEIAPVPVVDLSIGQTVGNAIGFLGAGIYEELLFRLILLSLATWGFCRAGVKPRWSMVFAVLLTSFMFSAAHYVGNRETLDAFSFLFRFLAGVFFSILFLCRGFGIAAGAHAGYDILVGVF